MVSCSSCWALAQSLTVTCPRDLNGNIAYPTRSADRPKLNLPNVQTTVSSQSVHLSTASMSCLSAPRVYLV